MTDTPPTVAAVADHLRHVALRFRSGEWCRWQIENEDGCRCALGGLLYFGREASCAPSDEVRSWAIRVFSEHLVSEGRSTIAELVEEDDGVVCDALSVISWWNDEDAASGFEVADTMEAAAAALEASGALPVVSA